MGRGGSVRVSRSTVVGRGAAGDVAKETPVPLSRDEEIPSGDFITFDPRGLGRRLYSRSVRGNAKQCPVTRTRQFRVSSSGCFFFFFFPRTIVIFTTRPSPR